MNNNTKCVICDSHSIPYKKGTIAYLSSDDLKITDSQYGKHWQLWQCTNCQLVFAHPMPNKEYLIEQYRNMNDLDYSNEEAGRKKNFLRLLQHLEKMKENKGTLLDIGAASGLLLELATQKGWEAEGIEPSQQLFQAGADKKLRLYHTSIEEFSTPRKYDVITAIDVLEHLNNPEILISRIGQWLDKNGLICIVTPDISSLAARIFRNRWWHFRPAHLYYFNRKSIDFLLNKYGFQIIAIRHYIWHFSFSYLISRLKIMPYRNFLRSLIIPLNLRDSMEIYAQKR